MEHSQINVLLDAIFAFIRASIERIVFSLILFYAVFKTATSIEDDKEVRKWSKYWIFYGIASFFCNLLNAGDLPMIIVCGILLFKFNDYLILHFLYDNILYKIMYYSRGYLEAVIGEVAFQLFRLIELVHWPILCTFNLSNETIKSCNDSLDRVSKLITMNDKALWKNDANDIKSKLVTRPLKGDTSHSTEVADRDACYERLCQTYNPHVDSGWVS
ncbi:uncharacterized protein [Blastocystis hominis]|uniref:Uncharacterized protein n=1 Tax=Blastocystis hominis TaxID=12968 RepID=D8M7L0_BLAHO|nr:uncharacterized protein [Blastocystis hominis]CBK24049.2 unnamed protein product [Blastocystis hominis]|eukprot:XP_012898097.1 uncharacterized protein [Blastocystis hominis]